MEFLKDPERSNKKLKAFSESHDSIYSTENDYWSFKLFDVRNTPVDEEFHESTRAVFAVAENEAGQLLLIKSHKRGWEFPGGHLNREELLKKDLEKALKREVLEESGYEVSIGEICFLAIIHNKTPAVNKDLNCHYPERSVMLYFKGAVGDEVGKFFEHEVEESGLFSKMTAKKNLLSNRNIKIFFKFI